MTAWPTVGSSVLAIIMVIGVALFVHELGHFLVAKLVGINVPVFSLGFGRRLIGFRFRGTDYRLSLLPFGAYVRLEGEVPELAPASAPAAPAEAAAEQDTDQVAWQLEGKPLWQRALIYVAGPTMNAIVAVCCLAIGYLIGFQIPLAMTGPPILAYVDPEGPAAAAGLERGDLVLSVDGKAISDWDALNQAVVYTPDRTLSVAYTREGHSATVALSTSAVGDAGYAGWAPPSPCTIGLVAEGSPAALGGLAKGDEIVAIDGTPLEHWYDLLGVVSASAEKELAMTVRRGDQTLLLHVTPRRLEDGRGQIGVEHATELVMRRYGLLKSAALSSWETVRLTKGMLELLGRLVVGRASVKTLGGPIAVGQLAAQAAESGIAPLFRLLGFISLNFAVLNLLPIPVLDGGHLFIFLLWEAILGRPLSLRKRILVTQAGVLFIISLTVVICYNDILRLF